MGLLDDAIREHLDLKRRRGADPAEVERAERDALGPVRRGPDDHPPPLEPMAATRDPDDDWDEFAEAHEHAPGSELDADEDFEPFDELEHDDEFESSPQAVTEAPPPPPRPTAPEPLRFTDEHPPAPPEPDPYEPSTAEFFEAVPSAQEHLSPEPPVARRNQDEEPEPGEPGEPASDEDVLEETPEFLSDTPDHDRLWFEQKPPRDFDFDA
jgi:hypothetical protein